MVLTNDTARGSTGDHPPGPKTIINMLKSDKKQSRSYFRKHSGYVLQDKIFKGLFTLKADTIAVAVSLWSLAIQLCGYQGLSLCHCNDFAEIAESLAKTCRIVSFKEALINTNCTPCFICHRQTIRMRK